MNPFGYSDAVWTLFREAPRAGAIDGDALSAQVTSNVSHAVLELQARARDGRIEEARFRALGCPTTIAVGAWLAHAISGADAEALSKIDARRIREALAIPEDRVHCALLGEDAVRALRARVK